MAFTDVSILSRHKDSHCNVEAYVCDICDKGFKHMRTLTAHMRMHRELTEHAISKRITDRTCHHQAVYM